MNEQMRDRVILPVAIPIIALGSIFVIAFTLSRVLLNVPKQIATAVALMTAFNLMVVFAFLSARSKLSRMQLVPVIGVALVPVLIGAAVAAGAVEVKVPMKAAAEGPKQSQPSGAGRSIEINAKDATFDKKEITLAAGTFELKFNNQESVPHNFAILVAEGSSDPPLFKTDIITGPKSVKVEGPDLKPGTYFFECQVHPQQMNGKLTVT
ncbi:MAG: cupredoxin domain-containing protein [Actinomycetota bacterium]|nr:cupredoxin domain-containing protein [Actinomycetota bacterium]